MRLRDEGKTVLLCSHLLPDIQDVCDRIAILHSGELKELGRIDTLLTVQDETQIRAKGLSSQAEEEIRAGDPAAWRGTGRNGSSDVDVGRAVPGDCARKRSSSGPACSRAKRRVTSRRSSDRVCDVNRGRSVVDRQNRHLAAFKGIVLLPWKSDRTNSFRFISG